MIFKSVDFSCWSSPLLPVSWICSDFSPQQICPLWCHMSVVFNDVMIPFVWSPPLGSPPDPVSLRCKLGAAESQLRLNLITGSGGHDTKYKMTTKWSQIQAKNSRILWYLLNQNATFSHYLSVQSHISTYFLTPSFSPSRTALLWSYNCGI